MLSLFIARRFRNGRKQSGIVSLISIISTLSIALGIAALIIGLSAMNGFERELNQRILSVIPHGQVYAVNGKLTQWQSIQQQLRDNPDITSVVPYIAFNGLLESGHKSKAILIQGIDPLAQQQYSQLPHYVLDNQWLDFSQNENSILIGAGLAKILAVSAGNSITLMMPTFSSNQQFSSPKRTRFTIAGIMNFSGTLGNDVAFISLNKAQQLLDYGDSVTGLMLNVTNRYQANYLIRAAIQNISYQEPLQMRSWEYDYGYIYKDIQMVRQIMYIAMVIVMAVACFSVVSTLVIAVKDKQRDIAILKTLGATNRLINQSFIFYGLMTGLVGCLIGGLLGIIISAELSAIINWIEQLLGYHFLNSHIYFVDYVPSEIKAADVIIVMITSIILSLLASLYPAQRACKIDPVKVLNNF